MNQVPTKTPPGVIVPHELTAENGAKAELSGEFFEKTDVMIICDECQNDGDNDCDSCSGVGVDRCRQDVPVSWTTIKSIWKKAIAHFESDIISQQNDDEPGSENVELQLARERIERLETLLGYAMTTERQNTNGWMAGFMGEVNKVLAADGDHRRCTYDGNELRLRSIHNAI